MNLHFESDFTKGNYPQTSAAAIISVDMSKNKRKFAGKKAAGEKYF